MMLLAPRFVRAARELVEAAADEARLLRADAIGEEHLLLALARDPGSAGCALREWGAGYDDVLAAVESAEADALAALGISLAIVREELEDALGPAAWDAGRARRGRLPFGEEAKRALEQALREAVELGDRRIGGEHVLLALTRSRGRGRELLSRLGIPPAELRDELGGR